MAAIPITVPSVGESITEGTLARWLKADGAAVQSGEGLFELETDKASTVVPAPIAGVLKISVAEGETVAIGTSVGSIDAAATASSAPAAKPAPAPAAASSVAASPAPAAAAASANGGADRPLSPAVKRAVAETGVDVATLAATGPQGRLTKGDVLAAAEAPPAAAAAPSKPSPAVAPTPSGNGAAANGSQPRETRQRMSGLRQRIAQRLVDAQHTAAILTTFNEVDMSRVMDLRTQYKESFQKKHGVGLGFMSFFVKAAIEALKAFPAVNGRIEGNDIIFNNVYDIGIAVSTERGLMVPVLRNSEHLSFAAIEKGIGNFATKAREGTISVSDLQGGTFTITNGGTFGSLLSTPILNPPQSGILGMHAIKKRPVVVDDQIVIRPMMYLALSYDHRLIDGREAVSFLVRIKDCIESPERMLFEI